LADFQSRIAEFEAKHVPVIAASVDPLEEAEALIETMGLTFPVGYGLDYMTFAEQTGAFYEVRRSILHATDFLLKPDGTIVQAVYATGPIGRLWPEDCLRVTG
jgi:peroxiredoxin